MLHGSLAPESAIVKPGLRPPGQPLRFSGTAIVYDDVPGAIAGVQKGELKPGGVLVLRGCGPKGGPAMAGSASRVVFAIYAAGLENDVAFVSDGQLSGLCNKGLTIAEVSPESAVGGPLSLVENGDRIVIDVDARTLDLDVPETELAAQTRASRRAGAGEVHWLSVDLSARRSTDVHGRGPADARRHAAAGSEEVMNADRRRGERHNYHQ